MRILRNLEAWMVVGGLTLALGSPAWGQINGSGSGIAGVSALQGNGAASARGSQSPNSQIAGPPPIEPDTGLSPQTEEQRAKLRNAERQKQLVADTQKLLSLANELKADMDKSTKDTMSLDVIRKADEIEKLAHNVKERMKGP